MDYAAGGRIVRFSRRRVFRVFSASKPVNTRGSSMHDSWGDAEAAPAAFASLHFRGEARSAQISSPDSPNVSFIPPPVLHNTTPDAVKRIPGAAEAGAPAPPRRPQFPRESCNEGDTAPRYLHRGLRGRRCGCRWSRGSECKRGIRSILRG